MSEAKIARYKSRDSLKNPPLSFHPKKPDPFLKELDDVELYEWAHLKFLKANRFLKKKKQTETVELLKEIVDAIDFKTWDPMKQRISEEIKIPAMKKLRFLLLNAKNYPEALDIAEKIMEVENSEENRNFYLELKKAMETQKSNDKTRLLENRMVIEMPSINKLPKSEEDNELNEKSTLHASEEDRVLKYNDELEDMRHLGVLRFILYPLRQGVKKIGFAINCCRRKKNHERNEEA